MGSRSPQLLGRDTGTGCFFGLRGSVLSVIGTASFVSVSLCKLYLCSSCVGDTPQWWRFFIPINFELFYLYIHRDYRHLFVTIFVILGMLVDKVTRLMVSFRITYSSH